MKKDFHDKFITKYEPEKNEEITGEYEISKKDMECFVAGVLVALLFVLIVWAIRAYSNVNFV